jgi:signal transduction histidine kinase
MQQPQSGWITKLRHWAEHATIPWLKGPIPLVDRRISKEIETDQERRAHFLSVLNRGWLIMGIFALISFFYNPDERPLLLFSILFSFSIYFLVLFFNNRKYTVLAGFIFTLLVNISFFGAFVLSVAQVGVYQALNRYLYVLMMMALAIIFAGAFVHRLASFSLAALNSVLMLYVTQVLAPDAGPVISVHIFWWMVATSTWLYESSLIQAFSKLQLVRADLENQVVLRTQKLQETVHQLETTQHELKIRNEELEAFSYSASHDLRAPLRAIEGYSNVLVEDYHDHLPEDGQRLLARMQENAHRMDALIVELLTLSRLDQVELQPQMLDPARLVQEVLNELKNEFPDRDISITVDELPHCYADRSLLRQVFAQLLSNAYKFTRERSPARIWISCQKTPHGDAYLVRDNGVGFDMDQADRMFAPFQRFHPSSLYEGTGIGLTIVRRIIYRHDGAVWADAVVDQGAVFYFTLGLSKANSQAETTPEINTA